MHASWLMRWSVGLCLIGLGCSALYVLDIIDPQSWSGTHQEVAAEPSRTGATNVPIQAHFGDTLPIRSGGSDFEGEWVEVGLKTRSVIDNSVYESQDSFRLDLVVRGDHIYGSHITADSGEGTVSLIGTIDTANPFHATLRSAQTNNAISARITYVPATDILRWKIEHGSPRPGQAPQYATLARRGSSVVIPEVFCRYYNDSVYAYKNATGKIGAYVVTSPNSIDDPRQVRFIYSDNGYNLDFGLSISEKHYEQLVKRQQEWIGALVNEYPYITKIFDCSSLGT